VIRAVVWGENYVEHTISAVAAAYPLGIHVCLRDALNADSEIDALSVTFQEQEHGLPIDLLRETDVLVWWGHALHDDVRDDVVARVHARVLEGMGLIVLHSGHFSKIFRRLLGTPASLRWREAGERERIWVVNPAHPIAAGLPPSFVIPHEEMYGEPFAIPTPDDVVFISWFEGGDVFRSGVTFSRGAGRIFYFRPGHETYPTYHQLEVQQILRNAVHWAAPSGAPWHGIEEAPHVPEPLEQIGP